jgi:hypothetical protein
MNKTVAKTKKFAWVLAYDHQHGTDITLHATEAKAVECAADIIEGWLHEVNNEDAQVHIESALNRQAWQKALDLWREYQQESDRPESLDISRHDIL